MTITREVQSGMEVSHRRSRDDKHRATRSAAKRYNAERATQAAKDAK